MLCLTGYLNKEKENALSNCRRKRYLSLGDLPLSSKLVRHVCLLFSLSELGSCGHNSVDGIAGVIESRVVAGAP